MNQNSYPPDQIRAGTGGWSWPRLFRQLDVGSSAISMMAWPYLHQFPTSTSVPPPEPGRSGS